MAVGLAYHIANVTKNSRARYSNSDRKGCSGTIEVGQSLVDRWREERRMGRGVVGIVLNVCVVALYVKQQGPAKNTPLHKNIGSAARRAERPL